MLHEYKYAGGDTGILYPMFWDPAARTLVNYIPTWIAPNVITLIGFIVATAPPVILFTSYGTKFQNEEGNEIPNWFFFYQGLSYFTYRMLDEMDGK